MRILQYVKAPSDEAVLRPVSVFLAGGVPENQDWQGALALFLEDRDIYAAIFDPKRDDYEELSPEDFEGQIRWEFEKQREASLIAFWFCAETPCPVTLYELGAALERGAKVVIGVHAEYRRKKDVIVQAKVRRPEVEVHEGWESFREAVADELRELVQDEQLDRLMSNTLKIAVDKRRAKRCKLKEDLLDSVSKAFHRAELKCEFGSRSKGYRAPFFLSICHPNYIRICWVQQRSFGGLRLYVWEEEYLEECIRLAKVLQMLGYRVNMKLGFGPN